MPKVARGKSIWPAPVYVARFRGGEVCRMSFYSLAGKPLDFDRGRRICCGVIGNERGMTNWPRGVGLPPMFSPATDIEHGEVDWDGEVFIDPFFTAKPVAVAKPKADPVAKLTAQLGKLSAEQLAILSIEVDRRLMATL